jgi:hypothetical protein
MVVATRSTFRGLVAFSLTELRVQLHESTSIVTSLIVQVVLLVFVAILAPDLLPVALFGAILFSMFALGQRVQNEAAFVRIDHKLNELYLAGPLAPEAYFFGMSLGVLGAYLTPIGILVAITYFLVGISATTAVVLFAAAAGVWLFASSFGYFVSTLFRDMRTIWPYASGSSRRCSTRSATGRRPSSPSRSPSRRARPRRSSNRRSGGRRSPRGRSCTRRPRSSSRG